MALGVVERLGRSCNLVRRARHRMTRLRVAVSLVALVTLSLGSSCNLPIPEPLPEGRGIAAAALAMVVTNFVGLGVGFVVVGVSSYCVHDEFAGFTVRSCGLREFIGCRAGCYAQFLGRAA